MKQLKVTGLKIRQIALGLRSLLLFNQRIEHFDDKLLPGSGHGCNLLNLLL